MGVRGSATGTGRELEYTQGDVGVGLGLFLSGVMLGLVGLTLFAWGELLVSSPDGVMRLREYAGIAAAIGVPLALVGVQAVLSDHARTLVGLAGAVVCVLDTVAFSWAYPARWNSLGGADYTLGVTAAYCVGLFLLFVSLYLAVRTVTTVAEEAPTLDPASLDREAVESVAPDAEPTDGAFQWGSAADAGREAGTDGGFDWGAVTTGADPSDEGDGYPSAGESDAADRSEAADDADPFVWSGDGEEGDLFPASAELDEEAFDWGDAGELVGEVDDWR